jgi:Flp pilus assembly protein TadD
MKDRTRALLPYVVVAVLCGALGLYLALNQGDEATLKRAGDDVRAGRDAQALTELEGVGGQAAGRAAALRGYAYLGREQYEPAAAALSDAAQRSPNDWVIQRDYAIVLRKLGQRAKARAKMQRALALNPRMALPVGFRAVKRPGGAKRRR